MRIMFYGLTSNNTSTIFLLKTDTDTEVTWKLLFVVAELRLFTGNDAHTSSSMIITV